MTWASDEVLAVMRDELTEEVQALHKSARAEAAKRNGLVAVCREKNWRTK